MVTSPPGSPRPRIRTSLLGGLVGPLAGALVGAPLILLVYSLWRATARFGSEEVVLEAFRPSPLGILTRIIGLQVGIGLTALAAGALSPLPWRDRLSLRSARLSWRMYLVLVVASVGADLVGVLVVELFSSWLPAFGEMRTQFARDVLSLPVGWAIVTLVAISVFPGVSEELLYRGYCQTGLLAHWRPWLAIGTTALLFAAAHNDMTYALGVIPDGLWMGYMAWRTGSVLPSMTCHAATNGLFSSLAWMDRETGVDLNAPSTPGDILITVAILLIVALPALLYSVRRLERRARWDAGDRALLAGGAAMTTTPGIARS